MWFPNRSNIKQAVQAMKIVTGRKFWIHKVEELYYLRNENKGADQLSNYCEADLGLVLCKMFVFS